MKLPKLEKKLRREDLFAISTTVILMWLIFPDIRWGLITLFPVLCIFYGIAIYYILTEKTFEKRVLEEVLKIIVFSEGLIGLISGWAISIFINIENQPSIFTNILYIFPLITILQSITMLIMPKKLMNEKIDKKSLLFTLFLVLGVLLIARYFEFFAFIAASIALSTNAVAIRIKDWIEEY